MIKDAVRKYKRGEIEKENKADQAAKREAYYDLLRRAIKTCNINPNALKGQHIDLDDMTRTEQITVLTKYAQVLIKKAREFVLSWGADDPTVLEAASQFLSEREDVLKQIVDLEIEDAHPIEGSAQVERVQRERQQHTPFQKKHG